MSSSLCYLDRALSVFRSMKPRPLINISYLYDQNILTVAACD
jgi:hypothetical protein